MASSPLTASQIDQLAAQGCSAEAWDRVTFSFPTDLSRFHDVTFIGTVSVGSSNGSAVVEGIERPCGIYHAAIANCTIGDAVRIARIGSVISGYTVGHGAIIEDVASLTAAANAAFGNGVELDVVNEGGGRGTRIYSGLSSHGAYLQAMMRHHPAYGNAYASLIDRAIAGRSSTAVVGQHARIVHCGSITDVVVGPYAFLHGVRSLQNGTIDSAEEHPTEVGDGVQARSFVISEGASVGGAAMLDKVFIGQAVKMGKQFSAENSLFFANCEAFHGEAVSLFAGPYTVTHHKSTLLIAGLFSFYNAGSGSNQSNHMYKLGPVHQGVFERGCKTGSFSYVLLESHVGAFSVVIGKHFTNINAPNLPFSYIHEEEGTSKVIPGMNLFSVGTVRDGEKWPKRDGRKVQGKKDLIIFDVFSPYTVEKMRRGRDELLALSESTSKEKAFVTYGGLQINRLLLRKGAKYYSMAVARYLNDALCRRIADALSSKGSWATATASLTPAHRLARPQEWTDLAGLITPAERRDALIAGIADGTFASLDEVDAALHRMFDGYREDEWAYVYDAFTREYGTEPSRLTREQALTAVDEWYRAAVSLHSMILEDSKKEFGSFAKVGYGLDLTAEETERDFEAVRGTSAGNSVVQKLEREADAIRQRYEQLKSTVTQST